MKNPAMKSHPKATHYVLAHKSASTVSGSTNRRPEAKKNGTLRSFFPIFRYLCPQIRFSAHSTRGGVKREPGANPGQSRCCETPQRSVISATDPPRGSGRLRNGSKSEDLPIRFDVGCSRGLGIRFRLYSNVISERAPLPRRTLRLSPPRATGGRARTRAPFREFRHRTWPQADAAPPPLRPRSPRTASSDAKPKGAAVERRYCHNASGD